MADVPTYALLSSRALISLSGPDWRGFLQGLITQDVETLRAGEARFGALLTPQGRLLHDLFVVGRQDGAWLDVAAEDREAVIRRLSLYRLRAKVEIAADAEQVSTFFSSALPGEGRDSGDMLGAAVSGSGPRPSPGRAGTWVVDPRLPALGLRGYGVAAPAGVAQGDEVAYDVHRLRLGVPGPADWGSDRTYPIEADFDLLNGIDFHKGCFVGQETTSRMKRRGQIKSRMLPVAFDGEAPAPGTELLAGDLRAGEVLSGVEGRAMALVRLDRALGAALTAGGVAGRLERPEWFAAE